MSDISVTQSKNLNHFDSITLDGEERKFYLEDYNNSGEDLIPLQSFDIQLSDQDLYKKYNLTNDEIKYIESNIEEMK